VEVAFWAAAAIAVLAVAGYVFIANPGQAKSHPLSPEEQTAATAVAKQQSGYIVAVVTLQADAYIASVATQQASAAANPPLRNPSAPVIATRVASGAPQ
jgi:hypothetical protein